MSLVIFAIIFGVYNLLIFMLVETRTDVFWISYTFAVIAFVIFAVAAYLAFKKPGMAAAFLGIPLASIASFYLIAELFVSLMFYIFQGAGFKAALLVQVVLLAIFVVVMIFAMMGRNAVEAVTDRVSQNVFVIRSLQGDLEMIAESTPDAGLKAKANALAEAIRYSDPMSNVAVADVEGKILTKLEMLKQLNASGDTVAASTVVDEINLLFVERNKKLRLSKQS